MAEKERTLKVVLEELFQGRDAALTKYALVRCAEAEVKEYLANKETYNKNSLSVETKNCLKSKSFLGKAVKDATDEEIETAYHSLQMAVEHGCKGRCERLVKELNHIYIDLDLEPIVNKDKYLDWLTVAEDNKENRRKLWAFLKPLLKEKRMVSMRDAVRIISIIENHSSEIESPQ